MKLRSLLLLACLTAAPVYSGVFQTKIPHLTLADGSVLKDVTPLSYSPDKQTVAVVADRSMRTLPLSAFPAGLQQQLVEEHERQPKRALRQVTASRKASDPSAAQNAGPVQASAAAVAPSSEVLLQEAADRAPADVRQVLAPRYPYFSSANCSIREKSEMQGWSRVRVSGTVTVYTLPPELLQRQRENDNAAMTPGKVRSKVYPQQADNGTFEVEYDVIEGRKLKLNNVSFNGRRVDG